MSKRDSSVRSLKSVVSSVNAERKAEEQHHGKLGTLSSDNGSSSSDFRHNHKRHRSDFSGSDMELSGWSALPPHILGKIFKFLPKLSELAVCSSVCKAWLSVISSHHSVWKNRLLTCNTSSAEPHPRVCHISALYNDRFYIHGGHLPKHMERGTAAIIESVFCDMMCFDFGECDGHERRVAICHFLRRRLTARHVAKRAWSNVNCVDLPNRTEHSAVIYGNKLWMFGGFTGANYTNELHCYDLIRNTCSLVDISNADDDEQQPTPSSAHSAVVHDDWMYVFGGWDGERNLSSLHRFHFVDRRWERVPTPSLSNSLAPPDVRSHCAMVLKVYQDAIDWYVAADNERDATSLEERKFPLKTSLTLALEKRGVRIDDVNRSEEPPFQQPAREVMWVFGGYDSAHDAHDDRLYEYEFETNTWKTLETTSDDANRPKRGPRGRSRSAWVSRVVHGGVACDKIYLFGGWNRKEHFAELWEMDIATRHWRHVRLDYEPGLAQHSMCIYDDTLYIFGGYVDQTNAACGRLHMYRLKSSVLH